MGTNFKLKNAFKDNSELGTKKIECKPILDFISIDGFAIVLIIMKLKLQRDYIKLNVDLHRTLSTIPIKRQTESDNIIVSRF